MDGSPLDLLRWCAERTGDLVVEVDRTGRVLHTSAAAARALGVAPGAGLLERVHAADRAALVAALGADGPGEVALRLPEEERVLTWAVRPLGTGRDAPVALWARAPSALEPAVLDTAAILHDIKNPISGLRLALVALAGALGEDEEAILGNLVERLEKVQAQLRRALPPT